MYMYIVNLWGVFSCLTVVYMTETCSTYVQKVKTLCCCWWQYWYDPKPDVLKKKLLLPKLIKFTTISRRLWISRNMNVGTTRLRGRPRNRWQDKVREDGRIVGGEGWQEKLCNREEWKKLLRTARNRRILHMPKEWMDEWTFKCCHLHHYPCRITVECKH
jgi:hypothetical protein